MRRHAWTNLVLGLLSLPALWLGLTAAAAAQEPLHLRIDQQIAAAAGGSLSPAASDAELLRRLYLDLAGRIPTAAEARAYLADTAPDKRTKLIDQLMAAPEYPKRMRDVFNVMLMERLGDHAEWGAFLEKSFQANKPWDQICRDILRPNPDDESARGAGLFFSKRLENYGQNAIDYPGLVRDVGRLFLGIDVQCAQCHDHLQVNEYKQVDFQGLYAFLGHMSVRGDVKFPAVNEGLVTKKIEFMSVFVKEPKATGPRIPFGQEIAIPEFTKGEEFEQLPDGKKRPKFSPLTTLAEQLPRAENAAFTRNIANRLWFVAMGRGLVHPLDLHHTGNPPSHPELLSMLAAETAAQKFDLRAMLRELLLTETYARSTKLPEGVTSVPDDRFRTAIERPLSTEQMLASMLQATGTQPKDEYLDRFRAALANAPRDPEVEFSPSVKGALFMLNDEVLQGWLKPQPGNLIERLMQMPDPNQIIDELYMTVLTRTPTDPERTTAKEFLAGPPEQRVADLGNLVWALLSSTEFCVNH